MKCADHVTDEAGLDLAKWNEKAAASYARGEKEMRCRECRRLFFAWELVKAKETPKDEAEEVEGRTSGH